MGFSLSPYQIILVAGTLLLLSIAGSKVSERVGVPALLTFLAIGMLAGSDGIGRIHFDNPAVANLVGTFAIVFILFSGGLDTNWHAVRPVLGRAVTLATLGVCLTAGLTGVFAWKVLGFSLQEGLILGAVVSSTDAAAVFALMRSRRVSLKGDLKPLLELESGSNDPMALFLTVSIVAFAAQESVSWLSFLRNFAISMPVGLLVGVAAGVTAAWLLDRVKLEYEGLYPVLSMSVVLLAYGLSESLHGNGFLTVYACGIVLGNKDIANKRSLLRFHDGVAWLMQIVMFLVLGLLVYPSRLPGIAVSGVLVSLFLMLAARPAAVYLCLVRSRFTLAQRTLAAWAGLRGAVPIILATFPFLAGYPHSDILHIVFFVVLASVLLQGRTLMVLARRLGVDRPLPSRPRYPLEFDRSASLHGETREIDIPADGEVVGQPISALSLPAGALILLIRRGDDFLVPKGDTVIEAYDTLMLLAEKAQLHAAEELLSECGDVECQEGQP